MPGAAGVGDQASMEPWHLSEKPVVHNVFKANQKNPARLRPDPGSHLHEAQPVRPFHCQLLSAWRGLILQRKSRQDPSQGRASYTLFKRPKPLPKNPPPPPPAPLPGSLTPLHLPRCVSSAWLFWAMAFLQNGPLHVGYPSVDEHVQSSHIGFDVVSSRLLQVTDTSTRRCSWPSHAEAARRSRDTF